MEWTKWLLIFMQWGNVVIYLIILIYAFKIQSVNTKLKKRLTLMIKRGNEEIGDLRYANKILTDEIHYKRLNLIELENVNKIQIEDLSKELAVYKFKEQNGFFVKFDDVIDFEYRLAEKTAKLYIVASSDILEKING